jgi:hypothetical protein
MHDGEFDTLTAAVELSVSTSELQRAAALRNGAPQLADIRLAGADVARLAAFRRSLNEDYDQAMC